MNETTLHQYLFICLPNAQNYNSLVIKCNLKRRCACARAVKCSPVASYQFTSWANKYLSYAFSIKCLREKAQFSYFDLFITDCLYAEISLSVRAQTSKREMGGKCCLWPLRHSVWECSCSNFYKCIIPMHLYVNVCVCVWVFRCSRMLLFQVITTSSTPASCNPQNTFIYFLNAASATVKLLQCLQNFWKMCCYIESLCLRKCVCVLF